MTDEEFGELYRSMNPFLFAFAARRVGVEAAADVVADTFEVAWRKRDEFPLDNGAWSAWVVGIAKNKVLQELQRRERKHHDGRFAEDWLPAGAEPVSEDIARAITDRDVGRRIFEQLSPSDKLLFDVAFLRDLPPSISADTLGISMTAYTTRVSRLRQRIRSLQREEALTSSGPRREEIR